MKVAPILTSDGKGETGETLIVISLAEGSIIVAALELLAKDRPRHKAIQKLTKDALCTIPVGVPV